MKNIIIETGALEIMDTRGDFETYRIISKGSDCYTCENVSTGETQLFTTLEIKQMGGDIIDINEALRLLKHKELDEVCTDDGDNYIDRVTLERLGPETQKNFEQVIFKVKE